MASNAGLKEIFSSLDTLASRGKLSRQRAFAAWFAVNFYDLDEDEALEAASADGGNDQGIDIAFYDESGDEMGCRRSVHPVCEETVQAQSRRPARP